MANIIPEADRLYPSKTLELAVFLHFDAIDQQLQIRQGKGSLTGGGQRHPELPLLQAFGPQAITGGGKIQHLHLGLAAIDEDEILTAEWIVLELIPDQGTQTPERFAHVGGLGAQPDARLAIEPDHPFWLSRSSTPLPRLSTMFQPGPEDGELPINDERSRKPASPGPGD
ncbi:hypothetical protein, partial [Vreelandella alkaliphila]|uniref:hypothetical protein n=1 Tax=Vreelandella alkaliphila TaxID=272774 RepID=UPI003FD7794B